MKKNYLFLIVAIIVVLLGIYTINYTKGYKVVEATDNKITGTTFALMYETEEGSGVYEQSTDSTWPRDRKYIPELSYCENGSTLIWDNINKTITLHGRLTDKCYVYFAAVPIDAGLRITYAGNSTNLPQSNTTKSVTCNGNSVAWNNQIKGITLDITGERKLNCDVTFTDNQTTDYLNDYIMHLCNSIGTMATCSAATASNQGTGELVYENGIRYEGRNPNNYVWFNNELWRIIGVFSTEYDTTNNNSVDMTGNLVKIMRDDSIGAIVWNNNNNSNWATSTAYHLLNKSYYNWDMYGSIVSNYCYLNYQIPTVCDFSRIGIKDNYRNMIVNAKWYTGMPGIENANIAYSYERDSSNVYGSNPATVMGNIGLFYVSDYAYSSLASSCSRSTSLNSYNSQSCAGSGWMFGMGTQWTMGPRETDDSKYAYLIDNTGKIISSFSKIGNSLRPVLYLNPSVYVITGDGSLMNPYIIGL